MRSILVLLSLSVTIGRLAFAALRWFRTTVGDAVSKPGDPDPADPIWPDPYKGD